MARDYRALVLDAMADALVATTVDGHVEFWNRGATDLFGYSSEEAAGKLLTELTIPQDRLQEEQALVAEAERTGTATAETVRHRKDGSLIYVNVSLRALRNDSGELEGFVRSETDVSRLSPLRTDEGALVMSAIREFTDSERVERTLQEKNAEPERASRAKDQFLATMSHELRTPLNAIIGFTGTLLMQLPGPLTTDQDQQLRTVQSSAKHLLSLINDLLDLAKIESGKVEIDLQAVPVAEVMREVCTSLQPAAQKKALTLTLRLPDAALTLHTDRRSLRQILVNLTNNAIKFTERGEVCLDVARGEDAGAPAILISVVDTGTGIRQEDQARLFEAFGKIARGGAKSAEGTGLGLHLSRKLAELLGGNISLSSTYGSGSRFTLSLPEQRP
jgi:PAS domain S-box-containing protein